MKRKFHLQTSFVAFLATDWKLFMLCCALAITFHGYSQTQLVKDINTQTGSGLVPDSEYADFTAGNTMLVKTFNNNVVPVTHLTAIGKRVLFSISDDSGASDALWRSDGTAQNTIKIKAFKTTMSSPRVITEMVSVNQAAFFIAYNGYDYEVWSTDGTGPGTHQLKDIRLNDPNVIDVSGLTNIGGTVYFAAAGEEDEYGQYKRDLWKSNGTATGTVKVATAP